jgi:hypothetical protein
VYYKKSL